MRNRTIEEILIGWGQISDPRSDTVRVLQYIFELENRYTTLVKILDEIRSKLEDLDDVVPDEGVVEQIEDIQNDY